MGDVGRHGQRPRRVRETLGVTDVTGLGVLRVHLRIEIGVHVGFVVARRREIDRGGEGGVGIGFRVLIMLPAYAEIGPALVVRHIFLAGYVHAVVDGHVAREMVAPLVFALAGDSPCASGIDVASYLQIGVVAQCEVVSQSLQIQSSLRVVAKLRHDQTARVFVCEGEETEGNSQRQRHIAHNQVGGTRGYVVAGLDFGFGQLQVEMRVVVVIARGVLAAAEHEFVVLHLLGAVRDDISLALFRDHVADVGFL